MWAIYWRSCLSLLLLIVGVAMLHQQTGILDLVANTNLQPSMCWGLIAMLLLIISLFQKKGLVYLVWGRKLALRPQLWQKLNIAFIGFFIGLAVVSWLVYVLVSHEYWSWYKLYLQPTALVIWPAVCGGFISQQKDPGLQMYGADQ